MDLAWTVLSSKVDMPLIFLVEVLIFGPQIHAYSKPRRTAPSLSFGFSVFLEKSIQN